MSFISDEFQWILLIIVIIRVLPRVIFIRAILKAWPILSSPQWGEFRKTLKVKKNNSRIFKGQEKRKIFSETALDSESCLGFCELMGTLQTELSLFKSCWGFEMNYCSYSQWTHSCKCPSCQSSPNLAVDTVFFKPLLVSLMKTCQRKEVVILPQITHCQL